jgi:PfaB family protein
MIMSNIAVVGMAAKIGPADDLDAVARRIYDGEPLLLSQGPESDDALARVIDGALADARLQGEEDAAIITVDPEIEGAPDTVLAALEAARQRLTSADTTAVVIAAGDEGDAGAIVLQDLALANARANRIYAVIESLALAESNERSPETVEATCRRAWAQTDLSLDDLGYLELAGHEDLQRESATLEGLRRAYRTPEAEPTCGLGNGVSGAESAPVAEMASLIKTVLCLHQRFLPAQPDWHGPEAPERWQEAPFYVNETSRPWFVPDGEKRVAAFFTPPGPLENGGGGLLILSDVAQPRRDSHYLQHAACHLLPIAAESRDALQDQLRDLQQRVTGAADLCAVAQECYETYRQQVDARYTLCLVGKNKKELLRDIEFAFDGVERAFEKQRPWQTPRGSYFTPDPLGDEGTVAFVYPGAFNSYPNLGRNLFQLFPDLHERLAQRTSDIGSVVGEAVLYPRSLEPLSKADRRAHEQALMAQPETLIESGTTYAMIVTTILRDYFHVQPAAALGYSLGEASMLWAAEVWQNAEAGSRAWRNSPLFKTRLTGPKQAVREHWEINATVDDGALWRTYLLKAPVDAIRAYVAEEPRVYLTMINTPQEGVIAGDPAGCRRVIAALDCHALPVPYDAVIHAEAMHSEHPAFVDLYTNPVARRPDVDFYSTAGYAPLALTSEDLAHALADMTCTQVDFPRLVQRAYDDGARIFVELGPQRTCTRWIDKILAGRPHAAMAINKKGSSDAVELFGVLARLLSHGVDLDLSRLYAPEVVDAAAVPVKRQVETDVIQEAPVPVLAGMSDMVSVERGAVPPQSAPRLNVPIASREATSPADDVTLPEELDLVRRYAEGANTHQGRVADTHGAFLQARHAALRETGALIQTQIATYGRWLDQAVGDAEPSNDNGNNGSNGGTGGNGSNGHHARFDEADLRAFATGSAARCFGPAYAVFEQRRLPRIPNGDLLLMSRIVDVDGDPGELHPGAGLVSEYDVPADAWFYRQNAYPTTPYAVLMEIAMQPCGFLSAYLGSALRYPETDFYFRNLDGTGHLLSAPDLRGQTVTNRVRLLSSTTMRGVILQQFTFALDCGDETFYEGQASFGYFEAAALDKQAGLDGGATSQPWYRQPNTHAVSIDVLDLGNKTLRQRYYSAPPARPHYRLSDGQLDLLDTVRVAASGGSYGQGYVQAEARVDPTDWFFKCHFYQDPVMPGSLGVQAIQQALRAYAIHEHWGAHLRNPHFVEIPGHRTTWKYRGQIRPEDRALELDVHVKDVETRAGQVTVVGDASVWRDRQRIYEVNDVGVCIREAGS